MNCSRITNSFTAILSIAALATLLAPAGAMAAGDTAAGKIIYTTNCASCHGETGKGDGPVGQVLQPPPRNFAVGEFKFDTDKDGKVGTDADLTNVITKGAGAFGGNQMMAAWGGMLSPTDIANVIAYIRTLKQ
jgi:mono/diheme cytochrome c family protein